MRAMFFREDPYEFVESIAKLTVEKEPKPEPEPPAPPKPQA